MGAELSFVGGSTNGGVPNIKGGISNYANFGALTNDSALYSGGSAAWGAMSASSQSHNDNIYFDASRHSSIYQNGQTKVKSAGLYVLHCIKYI